MINYFLKLDSKIEDILEDYSIKFYALNIGGIGRGINGIIITKSNLYVLKKILNETFGKDIDLNNVRSTIYEGIKQVFVSSYEDIDYEELLKEIEGIDEEINDLKKERKEIEDKIKCINTGRKKETQESEELFKYDDTIIL